MLPNNDRDSAIARSIARSNRESLEDTVAMLCDRVLPDMARHMDMPVQYDHCFRRIAYDVAHGDVWYDFVDDSPAVEHMSMGALYRTIVVAQMMVAFAPTSVYMLNELSLVYRDELDVADAEYLNEQLVDSVVVDR